MFTQILRFFSIAALLGSSVEAQKDSKTSKEDPCSISGVVVKMAGSVPRRKAHLLLQGVEGRTRRITAVTNANGRFAMKGIEPGSYRLGVSRIGFVIEQYGQRKPDAPGAILTLRPRQEMKDLISTDPFRRNIWESSG